MRRFVGLNIFAGGQVSGMNDDVKRRSRLTEIALSRQTFTYD
jgi:hypothetical protein